MKTFLFICTAMLLLGALGLPIGYYKLLRIVITFASVIVIIREIKHGFNFWVTSFALTALIFNPIFPLHFKGKEIWQIIDIICGVLFIVKSFFISSDKE